MLGYRGAFLFSLIFGANSVVYFAAEATIMGASLKHFFPNVPLSIALPAIPLAMMPLVWFGMRILARLQLLTLVLYAVLLVIAFYVSLTAQTSGQSWLTYTPSGAPPTAVAIVAAIGTMNSVIFTGGLLTADYARFVRRSEMRVASLFVGIGFQAFCYAFSGLLGLWFSVRYLNTNPGAYFVSMLAGWGTVFVIATQLRINLSNMYSGSIAFLNIFRQVANLEVSRHLMVLLFGIGTGAALLFDLFSNLTVTLSVIGMFVTCFTCLVLVDVYVLRPIQPDEEGSLLSQAAHGEPNGVSPRLHRCCLPPQSAASCRPEPWVRPSIGWRAPSPLSVRACSTSLLHVSDGRPGALQPSSPSVKGGTGNKCASTPVKPPVKT